MPLLDDLRAAKLIELALAHFDFELKEAEVTVLRDSACSLDRPDPANNAEGPEVRAEFLRWLITDPDAAALIDPKGLRVFGSTIVGKLDLESCRKLPMLHIRGCTVRDGIVLEQAEVTGIDLNGSTLQKGLEADCVVVHGPLFLHNVQSPGAIRLLCARIEGNLECTGAKLALPARTESSAEEADQGGARLPHPRRVRFQPDLDLLQLGGQLLLRRRLALLAPAVLVPHRPPPAPR